MAKKAQAETIEVAPQQINIPKVRKRYLGNKKQIV